MIRVRVKARRGTAGRRAPALREALARAVRDGAEDLSESARDLISEPRGAGPSEPGAPPRRDTGRLRDSLFLRTGADGLSAEVGTALDYGAHLEFGTQDMPARPWLHPAFEAAKGRIKARARAAVRRALRSGRAS